MEFKRLSALRIPWQLDARVIRPAAQEALMEAYGRITWWHQTVRLNGGK